MEEINYKFYCKIIQKRWNFLFYSEVYMPGKERIIEELQLFFWTEGNLGQIDGYDRNMK